MNKIFIIIGFFLNIIICNAQCYSSGQSLPSGKVLSSTGVSNLDSIVYSEINKLESFFKINVDFFYISEYGGANAYFNPQCVTKGCVGTVFLGFQLLLDLHAKHGDNAIHVFRATLAHEFGHAVQKLIYWDEGWKRPELHADYMAGYYIGSEYDYSEDQMSSFYNEFLTIGDKNIFSSGHHGTPQERKCAFLEGYYFAKETNTTVETANVYGLQYVAANNPCGVRKYKAKVDKLEKDIKNSNVGQLKIIAKDGKKYRILTNNQLGVGVNLFINQKKASFSNGRTIITQKIPFTSTVELGPISPTKTHPVYIYQLSWFLGERLVYSYNAEITAGKKTTIELNKKQVKFYKE